MTNLLEYANEVKQYLLSNKEIRLCTLYGSLANDNFDEYSDIDIEVDVSGYDNSIFITKLPGIIAANYPILFCDYAPSHMPESYIVSLAINESNPFCVLDLKCVATPHYITLDKQDFVLDEIEHTMKLWVANCKHYLRGMDCYNDISRMAKRVIGSQQISYMSEHEMLDETLNWLEQKCEKKHVRYINNCRKFIE